MSKTKNRIDLQAPSDSIEQWRLEAEENGMDLSNWIRYALNKFMLQSQAERARLRAEVQASPKPKPKR